MALKIVSMGKKVSGVRIMGDRQRPELEAFRIVFPWGNVEVTRAVDGVDDPDYWVHVFVNNPEHGQFTPGEDRPGEIKAARLDQIDKHAGDSNLGDFGRKELYHLAVRIGSARLENETDAEPRLFPQ